MVYAVPQCVADAPAGQNGAVDVGDVVPILILCGGPDEIRKRGGGGGGPDLDVLRRVGIDVDAVAEGGEGETIDVVGMRRDRYRVRSDQRPDALVRLVIVIVPYLDHGGGACGRSTPPKFERDGPDVVAALMAAGRELSIAPSRLAA